MIDLVSLFQKRCFVFSREHENQNVATIVNKAKIYERLLSTNILREKKRDSVDP